MTPARITTFALAAALMLSTTACSGGDKASEWVPKTLARTATVAGTTKIVDLGFAVTPTGESSTLTATFVDGKSRTSYLVSGNDAPKPGGNHDKNAAFGAALDIASLDLSPYLAKAQERAKSCKDKKAAIRLDALAPSAPSVSIRCQYEDLKTVDPQPDFFVGGEPSSLPNPDDPDAAVTQFFDYIKTYGDTTVANMFITRNTTSGFDLSWTSDKEDKTDLEGKSCAMILMWGTAKEGENPVPLSHTCRAKGIGGTPIDLGKLKPAGLAKVIKASGSDYWIGLKSSPDKTLWSVQSSSGTGASTYYDLDGNKVK